LTARLAPTTEAYATQELNLDAVVAARERTSWRAAAWLPARTAPQPALGRRGKPEGS
jgi:hypothetical protein